MFYLGPRVKSKDKAALAVDTIVLQPTYYGKRMRIHVLMIVVQTQPAPVPAEVPSVSRCIVTRNCYLLFQGLELCSGVR